MPEKVRFNRLNVSGLKSAVFAASSLYREPQESVSSRTEMYLTRSSDRAPDYSGPSNSLMTCLVLCDFRPLSGDSLFQPFFVPPGNKAQVPKHLIIVL